MALHLILWLPSINKQYLLSFQSAGFIMIHIHINILKHQCSMPAPGLMHILPKQLLYVYIAGPAIGLVPLSNFMEVNSVSRSITCIVYVLDYILSEWCEIRKNRRRATLKKTTNWLTIFSNGSLCATEIKLIHKTQKRYQVKSQRPSRNTTKWYQTSITQLLPIGKNLFPCRHVLSACMIPILVWIKSANIIRLKKENDQPTCWDTYQEKPSWRELERQMIDQMRVKEALEGIQTAMASAIGFCIKNNETLYFCLGYPRLIAVTEQDSYLVLHMVECKYLLNAAAIYRQCTGVADDIKLQLLETISKHVFHV